MSNEPTEEQRQAACTLYGELTPDDAPSGDPIGMIARLLAEREAKLQARIDELATAWRDSVLACAKRRNEAMDDADTQRARVAELEAQLKATGATE